MENVVSEVRTEDKQKKIQEMAAAGYRYAGVVSSDAGKERLSFAPVDNRKILKG